MYQLANLNIQLRLLEYTTVIYDLLSCDVVNRFPVCGILFNFGRKNKIHKEYVGTGY